MCQLPFSLLKVGDVKIMTRVRNDFRHLSSHPQWQLSTFHPQDKSRKNNSLTDKLWGITGLSQRAFVHQDQTPFVRCMCISACEIIFSLNFLL